MYSSRGGLWKDRGVLKGCVIGFVAVGLLLMLLMLLSVSDGSAGLRLRTAADEAWQA